MPVEPIDSGYYPSEGDVRGKHEWIAEYGGFTQPAAPDYGAFPIDEGLWDTAEPVTAGLEPISYDSAIGSGTTFQNGFSSANNSGYGLKWANNLGEVHPKPENTFDEWTWFGTLGHSAFGHFGSIMRTIFRLWDGGSVHSLWFEIGVGPPNTVAKLWSRGFGHLLTSDTFTYNWAEPVPWVVLQRSDGTKEIWHNGELIGSAVFPATINVWEVQMVYADNHFGHKAINGFSGVIGASGFQTRAWDEYQIQAYVGDPYGHLRPQLRPPVFVPVCLDADVATSLVMDADVADSLVMDADAATSLVMDADVAPGLVMDADVQSSLVIDADVQVCQKES